jgi:hypothetical protein
MVIAGKFFVGTKEYLLFSLVPAPLRAFVIQDMVVKIVLVVPVATTMLEQDVLQTHCAPPILATETETAMTLLVIQFVIAIMDMQQLTMIIALFVQ